MGSRARDVEAELNLPPGFRFHPTDEELVVHYLCRKVASQCLPAPVIAEVDLYKYHPWELPDKAMLGQREWYFFTPRDRKYPNGSRPNRTAGSGYWKATGADKPVSPDGTGRPLGIKKALVFYAGKAPKGVKTDWIMHEYRLADAGRHANKKGTLKLDDWVLCRLYNKKNRWEKVQQQRMEACFGQNMDTGSEGFGTPESDSENDVFRNFEDLGKPGAYSTKVSGGLHTVRTSNSSNLQTVVEQRQKEDGEWFAELNLDDLQSSFLSFGSTATHFMSNQDHLSLGRGNLPPF